MEIILNYIKLNHMNNIYIKIKFILFFQKSIINIFINYKYIFRNTTTIVVIAPSVLATLRVRCGDSRIWKNT